MWRAKFIVILAGSLVLIACGGASSNPSTTPGTVGSIRVALFGRSLTNYVPFQVAVKLGYFSAQGLDVTLLEPQSSAEGVQAVVTGAAQLAFGAPSDPFKVQQNGGDARVVMATTSAPLNSIVVQPDMTVRRGDVAALKGKTIGVPGLGGGGDVNLRYWLKSGGIDPVKDVKIVNVGGGGQGLIAAMQSRQVDAILSYQPFTSVIVNQLHVGKFLLNPVDGDGPALMQPGHIPWSVVWGSEAYIQGHVNAVRAFVKGMSQALLTIRNDPAKALGPTAEVFPTLDQNQVLTPMLKDLAKVADSAFPSSGMEAVNTWLHALGVLPPDQSLSYSQYVDSRFSSDWTKPA
jgi:NitT/TauT family transport system substrate-binding protein